jgi:RNA polymerase sigma-70 factor (ECF subfamily)
MSDPDQRLARKAGRGDRRALGRLYDRHRCRLLGFLVKSLGRRDLAEDVFQDVWIKVMNSIGAYSPDQGAGFRAWLYRVAANAAVDRLRYEALRRTAQPSATGGQNLPLDADRLPSTRPGPERLAASRALAASLDAGMRRLSHRQRCAVLLRHQQGMSYPEIAAALAVPQGTAKTLVHRGLLRLREELGHLLDTEQTDE